MILKNGLKSIILNIIFNILIFFKDYLDKWSFSFNNLHSLPVWLDPLVTGEDTPFFKVTITLFVHYLIHVSYR